MSDEKSSLTETEIRFEGLQYTLEESVPMLVGALALHLSRAGVLDLGAFLQDIRACHDADLRLEDGTGVLFSSLGDILDAYREDARLPARRGTGFEFMAGT
ncbi:hypothetical protein [Methylobacterium sp. J-070]|uniref:hypothetical protein n=1 Tax=Methylobacterium sp. J-070 TaxID=2836650 RepID=UPI001FBA9FB6|nr:hypothetical protein [Methylobacterium sp. J-070]MCJ2052543.1 hypothetical protein [Methylobacterium sp. J-070]